MRSRAVSTSLVFCTLVLLSILLVFIYNLNSNYQHNTYSLPGASRLRNNAEHAGASELGNNIGNVGASELGNNIENAGASELGNNIGNVGASELGNNIGNAGAHELGNAGARELGNNVGNAAAQVLGNSVGNAGAGEFRNHTGKTGASKLLDNKGRHADAVFEWLKHNDWSGPTDAIPSCHLATPILVTKTFNESCIPTILLTISQISSGSTLQFPGRETGQETCTRVLRRDPYRLPVTGLASWPGSGNTWTRHLIQQLTGIQTGSIILDKVLKGSGEDQPFPGEGSTSNVVVVKTHHPTKWRPEPLFQKQILLLRNPFDTMVAEYKRGVLNVGHAGKIDIVPDSRWRRYVKDQIIDWSYFVRTNLAFRKPQLIVLYEDMQSCLLRELVRIASFLERHNFSKFSFCCAVRNSVGKFYRNQGRAPVYDLYQGSLRDEVNEMLSTVAKHINAEFPMLAQRFLDYRLLENNGSANFQ